MPIFIWDRLPHSPAYSFVGFVKSANLLAPHSSRLSDGQFEATLKPDCRPFTLQYGPSTTAGTFHTQPLLSVTRFGLASGLWEAGLWTDALGFELRNEPQISQKSAKRLADYPSEEAMLRRHKANLDELLKTHEQAIIAAQSGGKTAQPPDLELLASLYWAQGRRVDAHLITLLSIQEHARKFGMNDARTKERMRNLLPILCTLGEWRAALEMAHHVGEVGSAVGARHSGNNVHSNEVGLILECRWYKTNFNNPRKGVFYVSSNPRLRKDCPLDQLAVSVFEEQDMSGWLVFYFSVLDSMWHQTEYEKAIFLSIFLALGGKLSYYEEDSLKDILKIAARHGNVKEIEVLSKLQGKARPSDSDFDSVLLEAVKWKQVHVAQLLLNAMSRESRLTSGRQNLRATFERRDRSMLMLLLEQGIDLSLNNLEDTLALGIANLCGYVDTVARYLDKGFSPNMLEVSGFTLLTTAAEQGHESIVSLLLDRGADVNLKDFHGATALSRAVECGHEAVVSLLLDRGADVNFKNYAGETALSLAASHNHEWIIKILSARGATLDSKDGQKTNKMLAPTEGGLARPPDQAGWKKLESGKYLSKSNRR